jgi:hypothetical protein
MEREGIFVRRQRKSKHSHFNLGYIREIENCAKKGTPETLSKLAAA